MANQLAIPAINTERLLLEPLSMAHSDGMFQLWSDPSVSDFSGIVRDVAENVIRTPVRTRQDSDRIIEFWLQAAADDWGFRWAIVLPDCENVFSGTLGHEQAAIRFNEYPWSRHELISPSRSFLYLTAFR